MLRIQAESQTWDEVSDDIFSEEFLLTRPLLEAIRSTDPVVLLVDEVDRVEVETEALLLEILSDYQVSIPELGTIEAVQIPLVFLTSNNTFLQHRDLRLQAVAVARHCLGVPGGRAELPVGQGRLGHERPEVGVGFGVAEVSELFLGDLQLMTATRQPS